MKWDAGQQSESIDALVDTGASITLVRASVFGPNRAEWLTGESLRISGVGGGALAFKRTADMQIGTGSAALLLPGATIYVTDSGLGGSWNIVLGHIDALHRLELYHRNQQPKPEFVLREPQPRRRDLRITRALLPGGQSPS